MDRRTWTEVFEYLMAVAFAVIVAWLLAGHFTTPLWGGLSSVIPG
jgi:hypothetical protein